MFLRTFRLKFDDKRNPTIGRGTVCAEAADMRIRRLRINMATWGPGIGAIQLLQAGVGSRLLVLTTKEHGRLPLTVMHRTRLDVPTVEAMRQVWLTVERGPGVQFRFGPEGEDFVPMLAVFVPEKPAKHRPIANDVPRCICPRCLGAGVVPGIPRPPFSGG